MFSRDNITEAFPAALPIILGYVAIGLPCGILNASIGMNWVQVGIVSVTCSTQGRASS
jgi:predicted branched-subunit amino acid permease